MRRGLLLVVSLLAQAAWPQPVSRELLAHYENDEARRELRQYLYEEHSVARQLTSRLVDQPSYGTTVQATYMRRNGTFYIGFEGLEAGQVQPARRGNFYAERRIADGSFLSFAILIRDNTECFITVEPGGGGDDRATMNVYLFDSGSPLYEGVDLPLSLGELALAPLSTIIDLSRGSVDWELLLHDTPSIQDRRVAAAADLTAAALGDLSDNDDGGIDADGAYVFIATLQPQSAGQEGLNCSGFVKWVVDGFYAPLTSSYTDISAAKSRNTGTRGTRWSAAREGIRDPYFGLDWTRNLAVLLDEARTGHTRSPEYFDVRDQQVARYVEDIGYPVDRLRVVLFLLTRIRPGSMYLASINGLFGQDPVLRQHYHTLVLFPYFASDGRFVVRVMERGEETGLSSLERRYQGESIHLVRIEVDGEYRPAR